MVVAEVVGVGIFLTPATMMRTLGGTGSALLLWGSMGAFSIAGALCYAELSTRYPRAGGPYVFLREAFGRRIAFLYGWMSLLVVDPGLTAALGIGFAQYLLATAGAPSDWLVPTALVSLIGFGLLTLIGMRASTRMLRATATAKLAIVGILVLAAVAHGDSTPVASAVHSTTSSWQMATLAPAIIAAFFAFGGWWDLGKMSEDVVDPRRTMPKALVGGVALVALIYTLVTIAFMRFTALPGAATDDALVATVGAALFGARASHLLAAMVTVTVAGSLSAVLLGAPRVYIAMARDRLFPLRLAHVDERRGIPTGATLVQVALACVLVLLGSFSDILAYFVPAAVFFLGLSATAILVLSRPSKDDRYFRAPLHPLPIAIFLVLIAAMLVLFVGGQPRQTLIGAAVILIGVPVSAVVIRTRRV
jgi:APA family basic amino acid/polyamine antiporter